MENKNMNGKERIALAVVGIFAISVLSGCVATGPTHDILIVQMQNDIEHVDNRYRFYSSAYDNMLGVQWKGFLVMLAPGETTFYIPTIAESLEISDDLLEYTFTIREGAKFQDGSSIRARDVKYSLAANVMVFYGYDNLSVSEPLIDGSTDGWYNVSFPQTDPNGDGNVVIFNTGYVDQSFLYDLAGGDSRFMLIPEGSNGGWDDTTEDTQTKLEEYQESPISCGPYIFKEHRPQEYIQLERFDDWIGWGKTLQDDLGRDWTFPTVSSAFKYHRIRIIPETELALVELQTGGVDVTTSKIDSGATFDAIKAKEDYDAFTVDTLTSWMLGIDVEGEWPEWAGGPGKYPNNQEWFRKALAHGINRTNIVENVYGGISSVREAFYPDWILEDYSAIDTTGYYDFSTDIAKAKQILTDNGYPVRFTNGNRFGYGTYLNETEPYGNTSAGYKFKLYVDASVPYKVAQGIAVQKDLTEIGVLTEISMLDRSSYLAELNTEATPGSDYNETLLAAQEQDPEWNGLNYDFVVQGSGYWYESPFQYVLYSSFIFEWWYGGNPNVLDYDFEDQLTRILGGEGYLWATPNPPSGVDYPYPSWTNDNEQFIDACSEAGRIWSNLLPYIPIVWDVDTYALNAHVKNFYADRGGNWNAAYSYWE